MVVIDRAKFVSDRWNAKVDGGCGFLKGLGGRGCGIGCVAAVYLIAGGFRFSLHYGNRWLFYDNLTSMSKNLHNLKEFRYLNIK